MGKRKAEDLAVESSKNGGSKKSKLSDLKDSPAPERQSKMTLMDDSSSDSSSDEDGGEDGGAKLDESIFKINEDYAKRFEHNKKREEMQRCTYFLPIEIYPIG